ncbi:HBL/NHE enterotoxin family protein [Bacillus toyonensis]|uniref:Hemolysin BL lytic component L2 n=1 Tax=Bacillus toyonensis TaxID=155322 RepID=A0A2A8H8S3_9BACI|nr:HBL/NHE enterotoxin family protein [Bacillus toyonensis]PEP95268.1 hemolysin BL lytic component L2 [Bacillus toyonensis]
MKNRFINGFLVTSLLTGGAIPICTLATPVALAETQQDNLDISLSLSKLGRQSQFIQLCVDDALKRPNIQMTELPALQTDQSLIKQDMQEWSSELYPHLVLINAKSKGFTTKFNSYYPDLKQFVDSNEDQQGFLDRLEALQDVVSSNQGKIQSHINELQSFQSRLDNDMKKLGDHAKEGKDLLSGSGSGKIDQYNMALSEARNKIQKNLQEIALLPGALNAKGFDIFKEVYNLSKELMTPVAESAIAAVNKGKEIEKSIVEAENSAEKVAKEANKSTAEIETAKKEAREKIEKDKKNELAAAAAAKAQEYDLLQMIDIDKIQKTYNSFAEVNKLSASQRAYLEDLQKQNETIYKLTTKLTIVDIQKDLLNLMKNDADTFTNQVKLEISLLENYKKDWDQVKDCITQLSTRISDPKVQSAQLKRLKDLNSQLEEQMNGFNS